MANREAYLLHSAQSIMEESPKQTIEKGQTESQHTAAQLHHNDCSQYSSINAAPNTAAQLQHKYSKQYKYYLTQHSSIITAQLLHPNLQQN